MPPTTFTALRVATFLFLTGSSFFSATACDDIVVTDPGDSGPGTLRQALKDICSGGTVTFDASLNGRTLVLRSGPLVVDKNLNLIGPGADQLTVSGGDKSRVLQIQPDSNVTVKGITLRGGRSSDGDSGASDPFDPVFDREKARGADGGGILNWGMLTMEACDLTANRTGKGAPGGDGGRGGGIFNGGALVLNRCRIFGNRTGDGGEESSVGVIPKLVAPGNGGDGGGIFSDIAATLRLEQCLVSTNTTGSSIVQFPGFIPITGGSGGDGGGLFSAGTNLVILTETSVVGNVAGAGVNGGNGGRGGGIFNLGALDLTQCQLSANTAGTGGSIIGGPQFDFQTGNGGSGGGIYSDTSATLRLDHCSISTNLAGAGPASGSGGGSGGNGGGLYSGGTNVAVVTFSSFVGNRAGAGGNGYISEDPFGSSLWGGSGGAGGAVFAAGPMRFESCELSGNRTGLSGGALGNLGVPGNAGDGGGVAVQAPSEFVNSVFRENRADDAKGSRAGSGGAVSLGASTRFVGCTFRGNRAGDGKISGGGGAISASEPLQLLACVFIGNQAGDGPRGLDGFNGRAAGDGGAGGGGGAILASANLEIANSTFSGNRAGSGGQGGAGYDPFLMEPAGVSAGSGGAGGAGGAIHAAGGGRIRNCTLVDNFGGAGGLAGTGVTVPALKGHDGSHGAGGLAVTGTNAVSIGNTLLALNHSPGTSADISGSVTSLGYNLVGMVDGSSGLGATGDLTGTAASPLAPGTGPLAENGGPTLTHALLPESPAINAGSSELAADLLEDQRGVGFPRLVDGAVDIGAYEFQLGFVGFVRFQITPSGYRLKLQGLPNKPLQIEWNAEARPAGWQPLHSSATDALGVLEYTDTGALTSASRFYRAVIPQP